MSVKDFNSVPSDILLTLDPMTVKVSETQKRYRKDMGDLRELANSIIQNGQIQPIVITRETHTLVAGGRRLAACVLAQIPIKAIYADTVDPLKLREIEIEENIKRKAFTPAEEVMAVQELHSMKVAQFGVKVQNTDNGGWSIADTAALLGKSRASVMGDLNLADMVKQFPQLASAKKKTEIANAAKGLDRLSSVMSTITENEGKIIPGTLLWNIRHHDALIDMAEQADSSIDILLTDPPYGINIDKTAASAGGTTGGDNLSGFVFDDSTDNALALYRVLATQSFRFTTSQAHAYVFIGPEFFHLLRSIFIEAGWLVHVKPLIWIKRTTGQCNVPHAWPSSCYEMLMYARKPDSRLIMEGRPDWFECDPVLTKTHPTEKPVRLIKDMLERVSLPGMSLYDPFMGSGAVIQAGVESKLRSSGCDILTESYATALSRLVKLSQ